MQCGQDVTVLEMKLPTFCISAYFWKTLGFWSKHLQFVTKTSKTRSEFKIKNRPQYTTVVYFSKHCYVVYRISIAGSECLTSGISLKFGSSIALGACLTSPDAFTTFGATGAWACLTFAIAGSGFNFCWL